MDGILAKLESSDNVYYIGANPHGNAKFKVDKNGKRTIFWNPYFNSGGIDTYGKTTRPAYIGLGHEMGHASDANKGLLHFRKDHMGYRCEHNGLFKSEWRAVYRENLIRSQAGIPLRTHHGLDNGYGSGPRLLDSNNKPINYSGL